MNIKINLTNRYSFDLTHYEYNEGAVPSGTGQCITKTEGNGELSVKFGESAIVDIPGMGSLLIQFLGEQKLHDCHDKFCDSPSNFDKYPNMALLRFKTSEIYWRFPNQDTAAELNLSVNELGTVCLDKIHHGEVRKVQLPEFFIPPIFNPNLPQENLD